MQQRAFIDKAVSTSTEAVSVFINRNLFSNYYLGTLLDREVRKYQGELGARMPASIQRRLLNVWRQEAPRLGPSSLLGRTRQALLNPFLASLGFEPLEDIELDDFDMPGGETLPAGYYLYRPPTSSGSNSASAEPLFLDGSVREETEIPLLLDMPEEEESDEEEIEAIGVNHEGFEKSGTEKQPGVLLSLLRWDQDFDHSFTAQNRRGETPAKLMERLLASGPFQWGLLFNGQRMRLMKSIVVSGRQQYFEVDLDALFEDADDYQFDIFWTLFRAQSFHPGPNGRCLLDVVDEGSRNHAMGVSSALKESVFGTVETLMKVLVNRAREISQQEIDSDNSDALNQQEQARLALSNLKELYEQSLRFLYRLLFVFYAESRGLLPVDKPVYRDSYSLEPLRAEIELPDRRYLPNSYRLWETLQALFRLIHYGCNTSLLVVPAYNGSLFNPERTPYLNALRVPDTAMKEILSHLSQTPPTRDRGRERIDYSDLGVEQLGSVYEGLLEFEPRVAGEPMVEIRYKDGRIVIPERECRDYTVLRKIPTNDFYLGRGAGRKVSGSYYTPQPLVDFLVRRTLEPLVKNRSAEEILELKVIDPAMGSGAFLVGACLYLAQEYAGALQRDKIEARKLQHTFTQITQTGMSNDENQESEQEEDEETLDIDVTQTSDEISEEETRPYRRLVAERCLYGVDLNEMAVELAKVSLWLTTLAGDKPLTFLDANLRCGNSLIGAPLIPYRGASREYTIERIHPEANKLLAKARGERVTDTGKKMSDQHQGLWQDTAYGAIVPTMNFRRWIAETPSDNVAQVHKKEGFMKNLIQDDQRRAYKQICDLWVATWFWHQPHKDPAKNDKAIHYSPPLDGQIYAELVSYLKGERPLAIYMPPYLTEAKRIAQEVNPFHWELEFPEIFFHEDGTLRDQAGFDAIVANPPWDLVLPNSREFFSAYDPGFRELERATADKRQKELLKETNIRINWENYTKSIDCQVDYFRFSEVYPHQVAEVEGKLAKAHDNTYKLFLEKAFNILHIKGTCGMVVPSGLYNDQGCTGLRQLFLNQAQINHLICFENRREIFPIHRSFKFVLFGFEKEKTAGAFEAAFMLQNIDELLDIKNISFSVLPELVHRFSPSTYSIMEFRSQQDLNVLEKVYGKHPLLGENVSGSWNPSFKREFNMTDDRSLFNTSGIGWPLYEGKMIHQYTHLFSPPSYWVDNDLGTKELGRIEIQRVEEALDSIVSTRFPRISTRQARIANLLAEHNRGSLTLTDVFLTLNTTRLAFRDIARNTDERTMIATILPQDVFEGNTLKHLNAWDFDAEVALDHIHNIRAGYKLALPTVVTTYLCGIFNSFILDYVLRFKVTAHVSVFYVNQLPVPRLTENDTHCCAIARRVARLVCIGPEFDDLRRELLGDVNARVLPFEEKEARQQIQNEIDALVAHLYGLNKEDLHHILYVPYTFPLVKHEIKEGVMREFERVEQLLREEG